MKINTLELENVKRIKAVKLEPAANGLTIIGGDNNQGKTSVLDAIAWALGGNKYKPSMPTREGALVPPYIHIELDNGIVVERAGKNSALKVTDTKGNKAGQTLLNEFVSQLALDLPAFLRANDKEKADTLLQIVGVKDQLTELENEEKRLYFQRTEIGRIRDTKRKAVQNMEEYPGAPKEPISALDLIQEQQNILAKNGENQRLRMQVSQMESEQSALAGQISMLQHRLSDLLERKAMLDKDIEVGRKSVEQLHDESTAEIEASLANIEAINTQIRKNREKAKAVDEANAYTVQYDQLTDQIETVRKQKKDLLHGAQLPLPELSVEDGKLTYKGVPWDGMSGSDQLKVATAIVRKLNPKCDFVLMDKLEQMDLTTLREFGTWLEQEGLQVIATRVAKGNECSVIIEDGMVANRTPTFTPGTF